MVWTIPNVKMYFWEEREQRAHNCYSTQHFSDKDLFFNSKYREQLQLDFRTDKDSLFIHSQSTLLVPKQIISTQHTPPSWHNTLRLITHNWRGGAEGWPMHCVQRTNGQFMRLWFKAIISNTFTERGQPPHPKIKKSTIKLRNPKSCCKKKIR